ncbi:hypothetical protein EV361DRAFT_946675 [Lentinula raphanica]|nr:hypothetical protein EV361DRAFT_946675 [Lentinula raphanica]
MSFENSPQTLYDDLAGMQHIRQYNTHNLPFVNHNQISSAAAGYRPIYGHQNLPYNQHEGSQTLSSTELPYHGSLSYHNTNQSWPVSYPQNNHLNYMSSVGGPVHRFPSNPHHHGVSASRAASQAIFHHPSSDQYPGTQRTLAGSLDPSTGVFYRTPEHPRLRTAQACEKCRTRKAKCSGEHPSCKRCLNRGLVCEYAKEGRVRGPNKPKTKPTILAEMPSPVVVPNQSPSHVELQSSISSPIPACPPRRFVSPSILPPSMSSATMPSPSSPCSTGYDTLQSPISSTSTSSPDSVMGSHCYLDQNTRCSNRVEYPSQSTLHNRYSSDAAMSNLPETGFRHPARSLPQRPYSSSQPPAAFQSSNVEKPIAQMISSSGFDQTASYTREITNFQNVSLAQYRDTDSRGFENVTSYPYEGTTFAQHPRTYSFPPGFGAEEGSEHRYVDFDTY